MAIYPIDVREDVVRLHLQLPMVCNMKPCCPYCGTVSSWGGVGVPLELPQAREWYNSINDFSDEYGNLRLSILWGEPLADAKLVKIAGRWTRRHFVEFVSNVILPPSEWAENIDDKSKFRIFASYHPHYWGVSDFLKRLSEIENVGIEVHRVFIVADPNNFNVALQSQKEIERAGFIADLMPYGGVLEGKQYPEAYEGEMWDLVSQDIEAKWGRSDLIRPQDSSLDETYCSVGIKYGWVSNSGDVYACYQDQWYGVRPMGNIFKRNVRMRVLPKLCPHKTCACPDMYYYIIDDIS